MVGQLIRRKLLNDNNVHELRALSAQMTDPSPMIYFPMARLDADRQNWHKARADEAPLAIFLADGLATASIIENTNAKEAEAAAAAAAAVAAAAAAEQQRDDVAEVDGGEDGAGEEELVEVIEEVASGTGTGTGTDADADADGAETATNPNEVPDGAGAEIGGRDSSSGSGGSNAPTAAKSDTAAAASAGAGAKDATDADGAGASSNGDAATAAARTNTNAGANQGDEAASNPAGDPAQSNAAAAAAGDNEPREATAGAAAATSNQVGDGNVGESSSIKGGAAAGGGAPETNHAAKDGAVGAADGAAVGTSDTKAPPPSDIDHPKDGNGNGNGKGIGGGGNDAAVASTTTPLPAAALTHRRHRTVQDYARAYRIGAAIPSEVTETLLAAIYSSESGIKSRVGRVFVTVRSELVRAAAAASDRRFAAGVPLSVFDGVPIAVKDMIRVAGHPMTAGTARANLKGTAPSTADDEIVARFRALGAIIVGTTVMTEFGVTPLGWSVAYKGPRNPHNTTHYSGGSSSGSAVAVALGWVPVAIGFDGGGSIRIPASMCGVVGLSTTYGRIPYSQGFASTMVHAGPIAASVADAALAYAVMAPPLSGSGWSGPVPKSEPSAKSHFFTALHSPAVGLPQPHLAGFAAVANLSGVKLGVFQEHFNDADPEIVATARAAVQALVARGATVVNVTIPHMQQLALAHGMIISSEFAHLHEQKMARGDVLEANTKITLGLGLSMTSTEFLAANRLRGWAVEWVTTLFEMEGLAAIVSPSVGVPPPILTPAAETNGESNTGLVVRIMRHIFLSNLLG